MKVWEKNEKDARFRETIKLGKEILFHMATSADVIKMCPNTGSLGEFALRMAMGFDTAVFEEIESQGQDWNRVTDLKYPEMHETEATSK